MKMIILIQHIIKNSFLNVNVQIHHNVIYCCPFVVSMQCFVACINIFFSCCWCVFTGSKMMKKEMYLPLEIIHKAFPSLF